MLVISANERGTSFATVFASSGQQNTGLEVFWGGLMCERIVAMMRRGIPGQIVRYSIKLPFEAMGYITTRTMLQPRAFSKPAIAGGKTCLSARRWPVLAATRGRLETHASDRFLVTALATSAATQRTVCRACERTLRQQIQKMNVGLVREAVTLRRRGLRRLDRGFRCRRAMTPMFRSRCSGLPGRRPARWGRCGCSWRRPRYRAGRSCRSGPATSSPIWSPGPRRGPT